MNMLQAVTKGAVTAWDTVRMISSSASDRPEVWEWNIRKFESEDRKCKLPDGAIVFTGSSSITFWDTLERDMAPLPVINRGFGGSRIHQVAYYADRILLPHAPRAVVLFAGTNDIAYPKPKTAQQVFDGYLAFVNCVRTVLPGIPVYYVSITPTPSRWKLWPIAREANEKIKAYTESHPGLRYIDLTGQFLNSNGLPDRSLYKIDQLHPNRKGYARWTAVIKPFLLAELEHA
jgi:lysophospholipase L1-like esterase